MADLKDALALHSAHPPIDLHADTLMWTRWVGYDIHKAHVPPLPLKAFGGHVDLPRMRNAKMGGQFFGLVSLPVSERARGLGRAIDEQIDALDEAILRRPGAITLARSADDIERATQNGTIAALLGIEGAHALEGDLTRVDHFARRGVRYMGLLHFSANEAGYPAYGRGRDDSRGLTSWGSELVERCESNGMMIDLSHLNKRGFLDVCRLSKRPPIVSHTGVLGAFDHWRNIDDDQLRAVAERGGCIGVIFCPRYTGGKGIDAVVKHLLHIINVVGDEVPALGSDWDGFIVPTSDLADPTGLPLLTQALLEAGLTEKSIANILRDNILRVMRETPSRPPLHN